MSTDQRPNNSTRPPTRSQFEAFYRENYPAVSRYVTRRVAPSSHDDVVAATFVVAWRKFSTVTNPSLAWLYRIASYEVASEHRRRGRQAQVVELNDLHLVDAAPVGDVVDVSRAFNQLSESDAELLRLVYWENLNRSEIAEVLGLSVNAVNVRYHRALERFSGALSRLDVITGMAEPTNPSTQEN